MNSEINHETIYIGLLGNPLRHSFSPALHNRTLQQLKTNAVYLPLEVEPAVLEIAVKAMGCYNFAGANVTIPFKEAVIPWLDELSPEAAEIGAVNVIKTVRGRGLIGHNTDVIGFLASLKDEKIEIEGKNAFIIGAGGAARSAALSLAKSGLSNLEIYDVDISKAGYLAQTVTQYAQGKTKVRVIDVIEPGYKLESDLAVNCSPVGMFPDLGQNPLDKVVYTSPDTVLYDMIYNPQETRFLEMGRKQGLKTINGLQMFVCQAAYTLSVLLEVTPPISIMQRIMRDLLA